MSNILFGSKDKFAIELGDYNKTSKTGRLRFWIAEKSIGDYKKHHRLIYAVDSLKKVAEINNDHYDASFFDKSDKDIFIASFLIGKERESFTSDDYKTIEKYQKYTFFFGDQFDSVTFLIYIKEGELHFLWTLVKDFVSHNVDYLKNFKSEKINISYFRKAVSSFLTFITGNGIPSSPSLTKSVR